MTGIKMSLMEKHGNNYQHVKKHYRERTRKAVNTLKILVEKFVETSLKKIWDVGKDPWKKRWHLIQIHMSKEYFLKVFQLITNHPLVPENATNTASHFQAYRQIAMEVLQDMKQQRNRYREMKDQELLDFFQRRVNEGKYDYLSDYNSNSDWLTTVNVIQCKYELYSKVFHILAVSSMT